MFGLAVLCAVMQIHCVAGISLVHVCVAVCSVCACMCIPVCVDSNKPSAKCVMRGLHSCCVCVLYSGSVV